MAVLPKPSMLLSKRLGPGGRIAVAGGVAKQRLKTRSRVEETDRIVK